jgi:uncharacterized cupredoxin-like copper-binding protein
MNLIKTINLRMKDYLKLFLIIRVIAAFSLILLSVYAVAGSGMGSVDYTIGNPGDQDNVTRTIKITAVEYMFLPNEMIVAQGETIKFVVINKGDKKHEFMLDTKKNLKKYAKERRLNPDSVFNGPNQIELDPDEEKTLIWEFTKTGTINFACPIPGHFKGMRGKIYVETK